MCISLPVPGSVHSDAPDRSGAARRSGPVRWWNGAVIALAATAYLLLGWHRRWVADDGLIVTRTVRQLLAGHGPVFNAGERVETNTSTLWTYVLVVAGWVTGKDIALLAVVVGLVLSVLGLALGMDAARRLHGRLRPRAAILPFGALVVLALPPFWDFATSGLETGLAFAWLGAAFWALVRFVEPARRWSLGAACFLLGLGPLVRPELTVVGAVTLVALWWIRGRGLRRAVGMVAVAVALPVAYEIFRMGYYGMLVPQTAIAKEASGSLWARGFTYAGDFVSPYYLWLPLALGVVALAVLLVRHRGNPATVLLIATPAVCSLFLTAYVLRIGGDFMHARMLLPPVFLLFLPVFVVPVRATWLAAVAPTAVWALLCLIGFRVSYPNGVTIGPHGIANERLFWVTTVGTPHPVTEVPFVQAPWFIPALINQARAQGPAGFGYLSPAGMVLLPGNPGVPWRLGVGVDNIGTGGALLPLDQGMVDPLGLAYPLAAHMRLGERGRPGHEKVIPDAFLLADQTAPGTALPVGAPSQGDVTLARQALGCGRIAELQQAVRAPLTPARFWSNLTGAVGRTSLRIPRDPKDAVAAICR